MSSSSQKMPKNILKLSTEEKRNFLESFDNVFSDIDGVVWNLFSPIKNAEEGFKILEKAGKKVTFITNNSVREKETNKQKFEKLKMNVDVNNIWNPADNIVKYLKNMNFQGRIYVIGSNNFKKILHEAGLDLIDSSHELVNDFTDFSKNIFVEEPANAVVMDADLNTSAIKLIRAQLYLNDPKCLFVTGATDMLLPVRTNTMILGPGPFLKILIESTKREPIVLGKPGAGLAELLKAEFKITNPKRALMIGDMLEQDVGFGSQSGFQTLAVLSGGCKLHHLLEETNPKNIPDYYAESMGDFVEFMRDLSKSNV